MPNFTKNAIVTSFLKLLDERPLNKITVKDIVEDCGINRNSFYYHFQDVPSLLGEIVTGEINRIINKYPTIDNFEECLEIAVEFSLEHRRAALHIYNSVNRDVFESYLTRICEYVVATYLRGVFSERNISDEDKRIIVGFYKYEMFGQIMCWLDGGMHADIIKDNRRLCALRRGMLEEMLDRCEK